MYLFREKQPSTPMIFFLRYSIVHYSSLTHFPIPQLCCPDHGTYVLVWVTNNPKFQMFVRDVLFKKWQLQYISTWHWLKVTNDFEVVIPFGSTHRKPYEPIMIGYKAPKTPHLVSTTTTQSVSPNTTTQSGSSNATTQSITPNLDSTTMLTYKLHTDADSLSQVPLTEVPPSNSSTSSLTNILPSTHKTICSVPGRHSNKPNLRDILWDYLPENPNCLELFARNLTKGFTSWGNEVLKFQQAHYFCPNE